MGGGVSLMEGMEELVTTTILIGRAISAVQFPGMYRIYDFHSKKAPKLKNAQRFTPFFAPDSDDDEEDEEYREADPADYAHFFHVKVGDDTIYIEDPLAENEAGWTALHTCCMSLQTVNAGLLLIEEMVRRGGHFNSKTKTGPGTFNKGWTALQMACAYGVEPLVEKLVEVGADVNAINSFGYSCMLEACHRGYIVVVKYLMLGPVDLGYIPSEDLALNSPFASAPCQSALGEAARSGFFKVVQTLLDSGAPKDLGNRLGWTALHEACFYNRMETVKTLLLAGCSATVRTRQGALPYHLACIPEIRAMLESMGGPAAVPNAGDTIDMLQILTELTMPSDFDMSTFKLLQDEEDEMDGQPSNVMITGTKIMPQITFEAESKRSDSDDDRSPSRDEKEHKHAHSTNGASGDGEDFNHHNTGNKVQSHALHSTGSNKVQSHVLSPTKEGNIKTTGGISREEAEGGGVQPALLHSGPLLGNLPAFGKNQASPKKFQSEMDAALNQSNPPFHTSSLFGMPNGSMKAPSKKADDKNGAKKKKKRPQDDVPKDIPPEFLCQLTQRPMSDPVKTIYGNHYDRTAIVNWLNTQGKICPLTGAPLAETDLTANEELGNEIKRWIILRSTAPAAQASGPAQSGNNNGRLDGTAATSGSAASNDDLYDF